MFFLNTIQKQQQRMSILVSQFISEQCRMIEAQKTNPRRRKGVAFFIRHLPVSTVSRAALSSSANLLDLSQMFIYQVEQQLTDCDELPVRTLANQEYNRIVTVIFDTVEHIAKTDRTDAGEEKGQLNYHIIIIGKKRSNS